MAIKVVVCLTTYNRVDCARISTEIIKLNWPQPWPIVHACSDREYVPALEDRVLTRAPLPLTTGALDLLASSIAGAVEYFDADYLVHLEGDTWIFNQQVIIDYVQRLHADERAVIAASSWSTDRAPEWRASPKLGRKMRYGLSRLVRPLGSRYGIRDRKSISTQFFIAKATPAFVDLMATMTANDDDVLEQRLYEAVVERFGRRAIIGMPEREPVHGNYRNTCPALHLACQHWPSAKDAPAPETQPDVSPADFMQGKKESLAAAQLAHIGPNMQRLLDNDDLTYYNGRAKRY